MLAFDIDGIVINSADLMLEKFNELYGTDLKKEDWTTYEFEKAFNYPRKMLLDAFRKAIEETEEAPIFYDGAVETLKLIDSTQPEPVLFVTNREEPWANIAKKQIEAAIDSEIEINYRTKYPLNNRISKTQRLLKLGVTNFVEDDPTWWEDYINEGIWVSTFKRRYNIAEIERLDKEKYVYNCAGRFMVYEDWYEFKERFEGIRVYKWA